jgi:DNA-binding NarL/FixJ family response regulator
VLLVDDHEMVARGLGTALDAEEGLTVVGVASTIADALGMVADLTPDVVVMDLQAGDEAGLDATRRIRAQQEVAVVLLSASPDDRTLRRALAAGCRGLVGRDGRLDELVVAIKAVANGSTAVPHRLMASVLRERPSSPVLSARELQVLRLVAAGQGTSAIAESLGLSVHTTRNHIRNLMTKLGAHSRVEAVVIAAGSGLIELPPTR